MAKLRPFKNQLGIQMAEKTNGLRPSWIGSRASEIASSLVVVALAAAITIYRYDLVAGVQTLEWDSGGFLTDAGYFAGMSQYAQGYDQTRPPFVPFLLSIGFRMFGPSQNVGYVVSAGFYFLAMVGCYLLAKQLMNPLLAVAAGLTYGIVPSVFEWSSIAVSDVEAVAVASLGLATFIMATNGHSRLYLVSIPLLFLTGLTRYSMGAIVLVAVFYLIVTKKYDTIFDSFEFYYSVGLGLLVFILVGFQWILYPVEQHETLSALFPSPDQVNPFHSSLGHGFYALNFPIELGYGAYGELLLAFFCFGIVFFLAPALLGRKTGANPLAWTMLCWFTVMFLYYSFVWPYADQRYSIEFAMPVIILAFWALSILLKQIYSIGKMKSASLSKLVPTLLFIGLIVSVVGISGASAANDTLFTNPVLLESDLNTGLRQALSWVSANVPTDDHLQSDWYTLVWWYAPEYNTTPAPLDYELGPSSTYSSWVQTIISNNIQYIVYVNPSDIVIPSLLHPVFQSSVGDTVVYKVVND
ncbi:MAG: glycosyltransferase family 39 protein [Nitrososphaerales archaeon]